MEKNLIKIEADMNNGLSIVKEFEEGVDIYTNEKFFLDDLGRPFEGCIGCEVSEEMKIEIENIYGEIKG